MRTICLLMLFVVFISIVIADGWHIQLVDGTMNTGEYSSIEINSDNYPCIVYGIKYAYRDRFSWHCEYADPTGSGMHSRMVLDEEDYTHMAYMAIAAGSVLKYAYKDGGGWHYEWIDEISQCGWGTSIAKDNNNNYHVAYKRYTSSTGLHKIEYAFRDNAGWHIEVIDPDIGSTDSAISIAVDSNNYPHITYEEETNDICKLKYASKNNTGWHIQTLDSSYNVGNRSCLAFDSQDHAHIVYIDGGNNNIKYAYQDNSGWNFEHIPDIYCGPSYLVIDRNDLPHVAVYTFYDKLYYTYRDSSGWHNELVDSQSSSNTVTISMDLDSNNYPYITYQKDDMRHLYCAFYDLAPTDFSLLSPFSGAYVGETPTLDWENSTDSQPVTYTLWYATNSSFSPHTEVSGLTDSTYTFPAGVLQPLQIYYWRVVATDGEHETWSLQSCWQFTYVYTGISLQYFDAIKNTNQTVKITWDVEPGVEQITGYNLYSIDQSASKSQFEKNAKEIIPSCVSDFRQLNNSLITGTGPFTFVDYNYEFKGNSVYLLEAVYLSGKTRILGSTSTNILASKIPIQIINLFPNPTNKILNCTIAANKQDHIIYKVYDVSGKLVKEKQIEACQGVTSIGVDVSDLSKGIYTFEASIDTAVVYKRFVIN